MSTGTTDRRTQILARLTALPDAQKARIKAAWPAGVPSLKSSHEHTDAQLDAIERLFGAAATLGGTVSQPGTSTETVKTFAGQPRQFERDMATLARPKEEPCISPSSAPSRSSTLPASSVSPSPDANSPESTTNSSERSQKDLTSGMGASTNPSDSIPSTNRPSNLGDEGPDVPDEDVAALRKAFDELDTAEQLWLSLVDNQCKAAGYVVNMSAGPTKRRWSIATAMLHCARIGVPPVRDEVDDVHEQTVRALLGVVLGEEVQPAVTLGAAFAALTIDEAERLAVLARAVGHRAHVTVDEDGEVIRVWGPAVDEIAGWVA